MNWIQSHLAFDRVFNLYNTSIIVEKCIYPMYPHDFVNSLKMVFQNWWSMYNTDHQVYCGDSLLFWLHIIHLVVCLMTGPKPLLKRALHIVRSRASSFKWEYPLLSLRSSNSFLRLLPCLPVISIRPCIFPSVTRCRRQFLRKMWPISFPSVYVFHVGYSSAPWL